MILESNLSTEHQSFLFSWNGVWRLSLVAILQAAAICLAMLGPFPKAGLISLFQPSDLPVSLLIIAFIFGLLLAPGWSERSGTRRDHFGRAFFWGIWNGAVLGFFLLVASRAKLLENGAVIRCLIIVAGTLGLAALLAARHSRIYAGLLFFWCAGLPLICYMVAEVFLSTPRGGGTWTMAQAGSGKTLHSLVTWALTLSPGTAAAGALSLRSLDGVAFGWEETGYFLLQVLILAAILGVTWPKSKGLEG